MVTTQNEAGNIAVRALNASLGYRATVGIWRLRRDPG
jgi:hypothetical protein